MARPKSQPEEAKSERFNLRFTLAELLHIEQQAEAAGIKPTVYLRRRALDYQVPPARNQAETNLISELNMIGSNINQIARGVNSGRRIIGDPEVVIAELRGVLEKVAAHYGS